MERHNVVIVEWTDAKMARLPTEAHYTTVATFEENIEYRWPRQSWVVVLEFSREHVHQKRFRATARFLVPWGPWDRMESGEVFHMMEGDEKTATVTVL